MITLNGKRFARTKSEFNKDKCVGYYRVNKKNISILDPNKRKIGVVNSHGVLCCATELDDGKWWYSFAKIDLIGNWKCYLEERKEIEAVRDLLTGE